eukprot:TRINITY_DN7944_c1_g3_i2.p1 TRINITY_DN7944_c1_g3~~TRINITY_DN7944_c1_g3_i2.p1  ORF type:complete len:196 (+),score=25.38 TRINITY_DN7944_c1_g3_i2:37-588(+)
MARHSRVWIAQEDAEVVTYEVEEEEEAEEEQQPAEPHHLPPEPQRLSQGELTMAVASQIKRRHKRRVTPEDASAAARHRAFRLHASVERDRERDTLAAERAGKAWASESRRPTWGSSESSYAHSEASCPQSEAAFNEAQSKSMFRRLRGFIDRMRTRDSCSDEACGPVEQPRDTSLYAHFMPR